MMLAKTARRVLKSAPSEAVCDACLAVACSTSLGEMREVTQELRKNPTFQRSATCASCHGIVPSTMYVTKCAHCSYPVLSREKSMIFGGELLHAACVRMLVSEKAIRESRNLEEQSRRLIVDAKRNLRARERSNSEPGSG